MKTVNIGQQQTDEYAAKKLAGFQIALIAQSNANNVSLKTNDFLLRSVAIKAVLKRRGMQPHDIVATTLDVLMKAANFRRAPVAACWGINTDVTGGFVGLSTPFSGIVQEATTTTPEIRLIVCEYHLPGIIDLKGDDRVELSVNANAGTCVAGGNASAGNSYIQFADIVGDGHEFGVPEVKVFSVQGAQGNMQVPAGNGVYDVFWINTDRIDFQTANSVIQSVTLASKGRHFTKQYFELLTIRSNQTPQYMSEYHVQDFLILEGDHDEDVNLDFTLNVANVTASNNYVVVERIVRTDDDYRRNENQKVIGAANNMLRGGHITPQQHANMMAKFGHRG